MTKEEILKQIEELKKQVENMKTQENDGLWKPKNGKRFCFVDLDIMGTGAGIWNGSRGDNVRFNHKVLFKTRKQTEEYLEYLKAKEKAMNEFSSDEWKNKAISKYSYFYCFVENKLKTDFGNLCDRVNIPYFRTHEQCQEFINKYEWAIKREMGIEE